MQYECLDVMGTCPRLLATCTHVRADGTSALERVVDRLGCCSACGVTVPREGVYAA